MDLTAQQIKNKLIFIFPKVECYYPYSNNNYGINALRFDIKDMVVWFSYSTVVAFKHPKTGFVILKNYWGPTTGKHLNEIDSDKSIRVDSKTFDEKLLEALKEL